jgi:hypothetical protein
MYDDRSATLFIFFTDGVCYSIEGARPCG